jgi:hypothetical protein
MARGYGERISPNARYNSSCILRTAPASHSSLQVDEIAIIGVRKLTGERPQKGCARLPTGPFRLITSGSELANQHQVHGRMFRNRRPNTRSRNPSSTVCRSASRDFKDVEHSPEQRQGKAARRNPQSRDLHPARLSTALFVHLRPPVPSTGTTIVVAGC